MRAYNRRVRAVLVFTALLLMCPSGGRAALRQEPVPAPTVAHLLTHASLWTARFDESLSGLLFRERYLQRVRADGGISPSAGVWDTSLRGVVSGRPGMERQLEANIFLLRAPGARQFVAYRDVYRVNGRDLTNHTERLQQLLAAPSGSTHQQALALTNASASHNLPGVFRNINLPTMLYDYLAAPSAGRLKAAIAGRDRLDGLELVVLDFQEVAAPTVVRGPDGTDIFATGRFWIHPKSGVVPRAVAEFATADGAKGRLEVKLELHETLRVWVPKEMTEVWLAPGRHITGLANYDRFQRLNVSTAEIIR